MFTKAQHLTGIGLTLAAIATIATTACSQATEPSATQANSTGSQAQTSPAQGSGETNLATKTTASGLKYDDLVVGTGPSPTSGHKVKVHYTGWLTDGTKFDSSVDRGEPFVFVIDQGNVIKGWDEGVMTMKVGGKRKLTIPPHLGYGARGAGGAIPPNATLIFDVQLLGVE